MSQNYHKHKKDMEVTLPEYPDYIIYDDGRIYSNLVHRELKFHKCGGYFKISLVNVDKKGNRKKVNCRIHILVAKAYHPNPYKLPIVNHIDGNKTNNHESNLEWVSHERSIEHAYETGLTNHFCRPVLRCEKDGSTIERYESVKEAAKSMDCHLSAIGNACRGTKGVYTAKGFCWKFETLIEKIEDKDNEEWKTIKDHPKYKVSSLGRIYSEKTKRYMKSVIVNKTEKKDGYKQTKLDKIHYYVHCLVADAFLGHSPLSLLYPVVDHKDNNPLNNELSNLHWVESSKNSWFAHNRDNSYNHKRVYQYSLDGEKIGEYKHIAEAAREINTDYTNIFHACAGKYKTSGGYQWRYENEKSIIKLNKAGRETAIIQYSLNGDEIKKWKSSAAAVRELGINGSSISCVCSGRRKTAGGYKWKYA